MHASLTTKNSVRLLALWGVGAAAAAIATRGAVWPLLALGLCCGAAVGSLQRSGMRESRPAFVAASTALEVRRALRSSRAGALSVYALWLSALILFVASLYLVPQIVLWAVVAGYAMLAFVRDLITLPELHALQNVTDGSKVV
jgi:hypothetical protein